MDRHLGEILDLLTRTRSSEFLLFAIGFKGKVLVCHMAKRFHDEGKAHGEHAAKPHATRKTCE